MINTIIDLLESLKNQGVNEINKISDIKHALTIGNMYEGLTKDLMQKAIFKDLDLRVCSGFIFSDENGEKKLSKQIDCMIVVGEGIKAPYSQEYEYNINQVIAVIEVKKDLFSKDMDLAYNNLLSVKNIIKPDHDMTIDIFEQAYENVSGSKLPAYQRIGELTEAEQYLYRVLMIEAYMPIRIAFGYGGFSSEKSLREAFIKYLLTKTRTKGYGPTSIPSLIVSNKNSLVKTNGIPFAFSSANQEPGEWIMLASANKSPIYLLVYLIWTRLYYLFPILPEGIFDNTKITINPFLEAKYAKNGGWEYSLIDTKLQYSNEEPWEPVEISFMSNELIKKIQEGNSITIDNEYMINECKEHGEDFNTVIKDMQLKRIIFVENKKIGILSDTWMVVYYNGKYYYGDNFNNRMKQWYDKIKNKENI